MVNYTVEVQHLPAVPVAVIRRQASAGDLARIVPQDCGAVWKVLRRQQTKGGRHVAIYWDASIRLEAGAEIAGEFVEDGDVVRSATPAGPVATATHFGPYHTLRGAHDAIQAWCAASGHRLAGPSWEIYGHWDPAWNADPSRIRTDVFYLLEA